MVEYLKANATKIDVTNLENVASISANDPVIGKLIADAMKTLGPTGALEVEESRGNDTTVETVQGMRIDRGWASPFLVNNAQSMETVLTDDVLVLVTDKRVSVIDEMAGLIDQMIQAGRNRLVVIADEIDGTALQSFCINMQRGTFYALAVRAPGFGDHRKANLLDICALTGATLVSDETGKRMELLTLEDLGTVDKVVSTKEHTTLMGGHPNQEVLDARVASIKDAIPTAESEYDAEKLKARLARLTGGIGIIKVGGQTEAEVKEKKHRIEDAVNAVKAALEEGIVAGGGVALLRAMPTLQVSAAESMRGDEALGVKIVLKALESPFRAICENAGQDAGEIIAQIEANEDGNVGYNAETGTIQDLVAAGVVDPVKVTRSALENAASAAVMILTTECAVVEEKVEPAAK